MKVHPAPKKRNLTLQYDIASSLSSSQKKLRRLPHIFAKVLELPFSADADVLIHETPDLLRFIVPTDDHQAFLHHVRATALEIYPGVTKIVIVAAGGVPLAEGDFGLDVWRFRLPASTLPNEATAVYRDGELVVTVPKGGGDDAAAASLLPPQHLLLLQ